VNNKVVVIILLLLVGFVMFRSFSMTKNQGYQDITASEAQRMIKNGDVLVIDVRQPYEFQEGHINGSQLIPLGKIKTAYKELDPNQKIILVCTSGSRSSSAANFLSQQGFTKVYNLDGGLLAWSKL